MTGGWGIVKVETLFKVSDIRLKPTVFIDFSARLKSCPDYKSIYAIASQSSTNDFRLLFLAQRAEEFTEVLCQKLGLFHGGEVATPGHHSPAHDVVAALCQRARRHGNLPGEEGHGHRRLH